MAYSPLTFSLQIENASDGGSSTSSVGLECNQYQCLHPSVGHLPSYIFPMHLWNLKPSANGTNLVQPAVDGKKPGTEK